MCEPVLARIADGSLDPADPQVRARCGQVESILRSLSVAAHVEAGSIGQLLVDLIRQCHARDVTLILKGNPSTIPEAFAAQAESRLAVLPRCPEAGSPLTLTVLRSGDGGALVVALVERPTAAGCADLVDAGWDCHPHAGQLLAETTLLGHETHERQLVLDTST